jgi:hypothetical protein
MIFYPWPRKELPCMPSKLRAQIPCRVPPFGSDMFSTQPSCPLLRVCSVSGVFDIRSDIQECNSGVYRETPA